MAVSLRQADLVGNDTLKWSMRRASGRADCNHMRGGLAKSEPSQRGRTPWRGKFQEGYVLWLGLNRPTQVADSCAEQSPEGEGCFGLGGPTLECNRSSLRWIQGQSTPLSFRADQRQEGNGAGNSVRLHKGSKTLEEEPQERIQYETRLAGMGWTKAA